MDIADTNAARRTRRPIRYPADYSLEDMRSLVQDSFCSMDYRALPGSVVATNRFVGVELGAINVFRHDGIGKRIGCRSPAHIRQHWVDDFVISMPLNAHVATRQGGHFANLGADSFVVLSTMRPFDAMFASNSSTGLSSTFLVRITGSLLRQHIPTLDRYCGMPLTIRSGAGRIMRGMFELALEEGASLSDAQQVHRFGGMLFDAVTNAMADATAEVVFPAPDKRAYDRIREDALAYIRSQLSNPDLSVSGIARHCGVSTRHLQAAFAAGSMSAASYIREARLQQCREFLRNPEMRGMSVIDIAMCWGFNDAPYFSRAYKAYFGKSPSADRT